jgi:hypothetical protein
MDLKHKGKFYFYIVCGLFVIPVKAYAQSDMSGETALLTVGAFIVCLAVFFFLIKIQSRSTTSLPKRRLTRKEKRSRVKHPPSIYQ